MRPRDVLAANINALLQGKPELLADRRLSKLSGVSHGTLGRIRNAEVATKVDQLEGIAKAFQIAPWELLVPPEQREAMHALTQAIKTMTSPPPVPAPAAPARPKRRAVGG